MKGALTILGAQIFFYPTTRSVTAADRIAEVDSMSAWSVTVDTEKWNSVDDFAKDVAGKTAEGDDVTLEAYITDDVAYAAFEAINKLPPQDAQRTGYLALQKPRTADTTMVDQKIKVYVKAVRNVNVNSAGDLQKYQVTFARGRVSKGVLQTTFEGCGAITSVTAAPDSFTSEGGASVVTVAGTNLVSGLMVKVLDSDGDFVTVGYTDGIVTAQTATVYLPANATAVDAVYTIKASLNNGGTYSAFTDTATVAGVV